MRFFDWVAAVVLFLELPVPLFWLVLHPGARYWGRHMRAGYSLAGFGSWGTITILLIMFHRRLLNSRQAPPWAIAAGLALIAAEGYTLYRVERELGGARLVGHAELKGSGQLATGGLYARMRHPRYAGMILAMLGACLLAWTLLVWSVALVWGLLAIVVVNLEERELRQRFGAAYVAYSQRVPRFLPFRLFPPKE